MELEVQYVVDNENMTDEEFENQEDKKFIITEEMIAELIEIHASRDLVDGDSVDINNHSMNVKVKMV